MTGGIAKSAVSSYACSSAGAAGSTLLAATVDVA